MALVSPYFVKLVEGIREFTARLKYIQATMFWTILSSSEEVSSISWIISLDSKMSQTFCPLMAKSYVHRNMMLSRVSNMHCLVRMSSQSVVGCRIN